MLKQEVMVIPFITSTSIFGVPCRLAVLARSGNVWSFHHLIDLKSYLFFVVADIGETLKP